MTFKSQRRNSTPLINKCYELYFGCTVGDQERSWAPHICCVTGVRLLTGWVNGSRQMPFTVSIVWREPKDYSPDCYICLTNIRGIASKYKHTVKYPDSPPAGRPVPHNEELVTCTKAPRKSDFWRWQLWFSRCSRTARTGQCWLLEASCSSFESYLLTQGDLNKLVRHLHLSKKPAELLGSILKGWNLLHQDTDICFLRDSQTEFKEFTSQDNDPLFCNDFCSVVVALGYQHGPTEWHLFYRFFKS